MFELGDDTCGDGSVVGTVAGDCALFDGAGMVVVGGTVVATLVVDELVGAFWSECE
jgi:hypothetical protein